MLSRKWDIDYLALAKFWAEKKSKDPSTQVGAVLVRPDKSIASLCYNGFPKGMDDDERLYEDRDIKLSRVIHAEMNAILLSQDRSCRGYTLYTWPLMCCDRCAVHVIQAGISRVVSVDLESGSKWACSLSKSVGYFREAGVDVILYNKDVLDG